MFAQQVAERARAAPDAIALIHADGGAPSGVRSWTYAQIQSAVEGSLRHLRTLVSPGQLLGIVMAADGESVAALLAAEGVGNPVVLLSPTLPPVEAEAVIAQAQLPLLFWSSRGAATVGTLAARHDAGPGWVQVPGTTGSGAPIPVDDAFIIQLTSGSMGPSRLAVRTRLGVFAEIRAVTERLALTSNDTILCGSSISHSYGLIGGTLAPLLAGACTALASTGAEVRLLGAMEPSTIVFGLGSHYQALLDAPPAGDLFSRARLLLSAGAPLPAQLFDSFLRHFGTPIRQDYGTTETGTISLDVAGTAVHGCVGWPLSHVEVCLSPPSNIPLEGEEEGEIQVRSEATARGYLVHGVITPCQDEAGWYGTRDAGHRDEQGRLWVGRRLRDPIVVGDVSIRPETVERALAAMPGVQETIAVPARDDHGQPALKVVVVAPDVHVADIRRWCREHLPPDVEPAFIELRAGLPRSPAGKILVKYLIER